VREEQAFDAVDHEAGEFERGIGFGAVQVREGADWDRA
jgi:hypothetical protein